jgi:integrase
MGRLREGTTIWRKNAKGEYQRFARVQWTDERGKRRQKEKLAVSESHAKRLIKDMLRELEQHGPQAFDAEKMTFAELADYYEKHHLVPAQYIDGRKVDGLRSLAPARSRLKALRDFFTEKKVRLITKKDILEYRRQRLATPIISKSNRKDERLKTRQRSVTCVNRELETLRKMLYIAIEEGWIYRNPLTKMKGESLILRAHEKERDRVYSFDEEKALLAACTGRRTHLRPILICAFDTGMRKGEILTLSWSDVDLVTGWINIKAFNTKTQRDRTLKITPRLHRELLTLNEGRPHEPTDLVFGVEDNVSKSFRSACRECEIGDAHFHDIRHTFATRLARAGVPQAEIERLLGHTQPRTTYRYINLDAQSAENAANVLASLHEPISAGSLVN